MNANGSFRAARRLALVALFLAALLPLVLGEGRERSLAFESLRLAAAVVLISVPLGALLALLITRSDAPGRRLGAVFTVALLFVPLYLQAAAWQAGFGPEGGFTLGYLKGVWLEGWFGAVWVHAMAAAPWAALITAVGLRAVEPELEEAALLDASAPRVLLAVTLRRAAPALVVAVLWVFVLVFGEMTVTDLFKIRTYAEELYTQMQLGPEPGAAPASAAPGMAASFALAMFCLTVGARLAAGARFTAGRRPLRFRLGAWRWPMAAIALVIVLIIVGVPLGSLMYKAGVEVASTPTGRLRSWSALKCLATVLESPWRFRDELFWSFSIGALASTAALTAAIPLAWWGRAGGWRGLPALTVASLSLALPGPVIGMGIIWLLNRPDPAWLTTWLDWLGGAPPRGLIGALYDHPLIAPTMALTARTLAATILVCWCAFQSLAREPLDSAALDGAGPLRRLLLIALPQRRAALVIAWLAALAICLADVGASILVTPPGVTTLAVQIFNQLHYGAESTVAGICLALVGFYGLLAGAMIWLAERGRDEFG